MALEKLLPFVYRVHEPPAPEKLAVLKDLLDTVGVPSGTVAPGVLPKQLSALLSRAKEGPYAVAVNSAMLRAMQKARYNDKTSAIMGWHLPIMSISLLRSDAIPTLRSTAFSRRSAWACAGRNQPALRVLRRGGGKAVERRRACRNGSGARL